MKKLILIDGHALMFRMYYAFLRRPMINSKGVDTSVLFGFTKYLLELINKEQPTHLAVAFDPPCKTFRHEFYSEYKANRSAAPEVIKESLEPLCNIVKALNIPVLMSEGFEADDVIGSVAKQWSQKGYTVVMVSPDKDLGQLIDDNIFQFKPGKSGAENEILGKKEICEKFSIENPLQIIDILAIWGDASDNVPGVRGIGEVGAKKLVSQFGSVENIIANADKLPAKQKQSVLDSIESLKTSKFLVTIRTDIEMNLTEEDLRVSFTNSSKAKEFLKEYECFSLVSLIPGGDATPQESNNVNNMQFNTEQVTVGEVLKKAKDNKRIAISIGNDNSIYVAAGEANATIGSAICKKTEEIREVIEDKDIIKIGHNFKGLLKLLWKEEIYPKGTIADLELMHYLINPEVSHRVDILSSSLLGIDPSLIATQGKAPAEEIQMDLFSFAEDTQGDSAIENERQSKRIETALMLPLYSALAKKFEEDKGVEELYYSIEMPLISVLAQMEVNGFKIDTNMLSAFGEELGKELALIENKIRELAEQPDLNVSSPMQLGVVLFEKLKIDPKAKKNKRGNYSTDEETLTELADKHPIVNEILRFRAIKKLLSTYIEPFPTLIDPTDGKVHTTFNQALTATGRLSSVKPNLQNIPIRTEMGKEIRRAFIGSSAQHRIVSADYSQIELRIMAALSGDNDMIEAFRNGKDIHTATAAKIFKEETEDVTSDQRRIAKTANFGIIYGISPFGLSQRLNIPRKEAKELIEEYFLNYPAISEYIERMKVQARENGFVQTIFGRKRYLKDINSRNATVRGFAERNAINAPIQGSAADIIKMAMINVAKALKENNLESKMILQVHDELVFDCPVGEVEKVKAIVREQMENVTRLSVPLTVECNDGENWLQAH
ncbi:MAG: DNA polymerase I [Bacteroidales bacterium]|nr:DNA polymerase I [Bacteroidales bacterium]